MNHCKQLLFIVNIRRVGGGQKGKRREENRRRTGGLKVVCNDS
jgi:hypothetical protein